VYILFIFFGLLCCQSKIHFFFNASNPTIKNGGFIMESKKAIYNLIPQQYYPKTELIKEGTAVVEIKAIIEQSNIRYPFIKARRWFAWFRCKENKYARRFRTICIKGKF
jgi:hypothetical protein